MNGLHNLSQFIQAGLVCSLVFAENRLKSSVLLSRLTALANSQTNLVQREGIVPVAASIYYADQTYRPVNLYCISIMKEFLSSIVCLRKSKYHYTHFHSH